MDAAIHTSLPTYSPAPANPGKPYIYTLLRDDEALVAHHGVNEPNPHN